MRYVDAEAVMALGPLAARQAITDALRAGVDPGADTPRVPVDLAQGQLLLMPSEDRGHCGVKVATVAPRNPDLGLPRIQAAYLLFDGRTLALQAVLDGTALTALRTPAVSLAAVEAHLPDRPLRIAAIGAGPQAVGHVAAFTAARGSTTTTYLVRDPTRTEVDATRLGSTDARDALAAADVIVCATSARTPLFAAEVVPDDAVVIAVGSHEPDARELDGALLGRSTVVVEDVPTARREAGDVVLAIADGALAETDLVSMRDVVLGSARPPRDRPLVFKSVGMAWEDLAVATAVAVADPD
jgi:ornithine cyclodeaminase